MADIDSQGQIDLERHGPPPRKPTWLWKQPIDSSYSCESRPESTRSRLKNRTWSGLTLEVLVGWPARSNLPKSTTEDLSQTSQKREAQDALMYVVTGIPLNSDIRLHSPVLTLSCNWYLEFLEFEILDAWGTLFAPVLENINQKTTVPSDHDIAIAFQFLTAVASELERKELALVNIVDGIYNKCLLHETDYDRSKAHQLAFAALGWITVLYTPSSSPRPNCLQLDDSCNDSLRGDAKEKRTSYHKPKTIWRLEEDIIDNDQLHQPIFRLLNRFGEIIPRCPRNCITPQLSHDISSVISGRYDHKIDISFVCFHAVSVVAGVKIQWVNCLSLHLEFDSRSKTLKVFRFPSVCMTMYRNKDRSLLSKIFEDFAIASSGSETCEMDYSNDYLREVLLSYRLLFGEERRSRRTFRKWVSRWQSEWKSTPENPKPPADPLLLVLGSQSWESDEARQIYDEIDAPDPASPYSPTVDFMFFGKRLLDLQTYVRDRRSNSIVGLWSDTRNLQWWWTFWAVIIIGGASLAFALFQSVLQILQVVLAQQQLQQGNAGPQDLKLLVRELKDVIKSDL